ncbi:hypothetical protein WICPIJ_000520 [Wickerhamomyces pijperi]|uniref:Uncharacterized protein n=1 Tax=Wickerhamomyces pijperi TaxID=599730 RepID=A0A9P8QGA6_WICPI|nr:hypothetical protein WICPIJ_000520 [Wickerhamomyces pijperi]
MFFAVPFLYMVEFLSGTFAAIRSSNGEISQPALDLFTKFEIMRNAFVIVIVASLFFIYQRSKEFLYHVAILISKGYYQLDDGALDDFPKPSETNYTPLSMFVMVLLTVCTCLLFNVFHIYFTLFDMGTICVFLLLMNFLIDRQTVLTHGF